MAELGNIKVRKVIPRLGVGLSITSGALIFLGIVIAALLFHLGIFEVIAISSALALFYVLLLLLFLEPIVIQRIKETRVVERPIVLEVEKRVIVETSRAHLDIPRYSYLGSTLTLVVHTRNCRIGKSIKRKYKLSDNNLNLFIKQKFKKCKLCFES